MASVRKRKMARSSVKKNTKRTKDKKREVNITSHPVMQANWDKKLTLKQNYKKLGLTVRLGTFTGGQEADITTLTEDREQESANKINPEAVANETDPAKIPEGEARLVRDPETNAVVQVIYGTMKPGSKKITKESTSIIPELEKYAEQHARKVKVYKTSEREEAWLEQLYEKHGDDYEKMKWDKKLNPIFLSEGALRKRITKWKKLHGKE